MDARPSVAFCIAKGIKAELRFLFNTDLLNGIILEEPTQVELEKHMFDVIVFIGIPVTPIMNTDNVLYYNQVYDVKLDDIYGKINYPLFTIFSTFSCWTSKVMDIYDSIKSQDAVFKWRWIITLPKGNLDYTKFIKLMHKDYRVHVVTRIEELAQSKFLLYIKDNILLPKALEIIYSDAIRNPKVTHFYSDCVIAEPATSPISPSTNHADYYFNNAPVRMLNINANIFDPDITVQISGSTKSVDSKTIRIIKTPLASTIKTAMNNPRHGNYLWEDCAVLVWVPGNLSQVPGRLGLSGLSGQSGQEGVPGQSGQEGVSNEFDQNILNITLNSILIQDFYYFKTNVQIITVSNVLKRGIYNHPCVSHVFTNGLDKMSSLDFARKHAVSNKYITYLEYGNTFSVHDYLDNMVNFAHMSQADLLISSYQYNGKFQGITKDSKNVHYNALFHQTDFPIKLDSCLIDAQQLDKMPCKKCWTLSPKLCIKGLTVTTGPMGATGPTGPTVTPVTTDYSDPLTMVGANHLKDVLISPSKVETLKNIFQQRQKSDDTLYFLMPYRNRAEHLAKFIPHMHKYCNDLNIKHKFVVIEQIDQKDFRRVLLVNCGYKYVSKRHKNAYYCLQDVDTVPVMLTNYYRPDKGVINRLYGYYDTLCGCYLFNGEDFEKMNGFSNSYQGWGGEDTDLCARALKANVNVYSNYQFTRADKAFNAFIEYDDPCSPQAVANKLGSENYKRNLYLSIYDKYDYKTDGLDQMPEIESLISVEEKELYTLIKVDTDKILEYTKTRIN